MQMKLDTVAKMLFVYVQHLATCKHEMVKPTRLVSCSSLFCHEL